jgi:hypothetical protein
MAFVTGICNRTETAALPRQVVIGGKSVDSGAIRRFRVPKPAKSPVYGTWHIPSSFCCNRRRHLAYVRASAAHHRCRF